MGYSYATFDWLNDLGLTPGSRVLDIGSQDLYLSDERELERVNRFIAQHDGTPVAPLVYPCVIPTADIWSRAGFDYQCADIDERPKTVRVDLQSPDFPHELKSQFDLIVNAGTTEHLANPICGFSFMHFACRDGGIIASDVPFCGYGNHALMNPTAKFWHLMAIHNHYKVLAAGVRKSGETPGHGPYFNDDFNYIRGLDEAMNLSWMISIAFRKDGSTAFVPPMDYAGDISLDSKLALIRASMAPFGKAWSEQETSIGIERVSRYNWNPPSVSLFRRALRPIVRPIRRALGI